MEWLCEINRQWNFLSWNYFLQGPINYAGLQEFCSNYNDKYNETCLIMNYWPSSLVEIYEGLLTVVILGGSILG
jgi:hypothetical protein